MNIMQEMNEFHERQRELDEAFECGAEAMRGEALSVCCKSCVGPIDALGLPSLHKAVPVGSRATSGSAKPSRPA